MRKVHFALEWIRKVRKNKNKNKCVRKIMFRLIASVGSFDTLLACDIEHQVLRLFGDGTRQDGRPISGHSSHGTCRHRSRMNRFAHLCLGGCSRVRGIVGCESPLRFRNEVRTNTRVYRQIDLFYR